MPPITQDQHRTESERPPLLRRAILFLSLTIVSFAVEGVCPPASRTAAAASGQTSVTLTPVLPAKGFGIQDTGTTNGYYLFDEATSSAANWSVVAWSNPPHADYLLPFRANQRGDAEQWTADSSATAVQSMTVTLQLPTAAGAAQEVLQQTGMKGGSGCLTAQGAPLEYDLFVTGNDKTTNPYYPSAYLIDGTNPPASPPLSTVTAIKVTGTVTLVKAQTTAATGPCAVNQSGMLYALIFNDLVSKQTLYYQLNFNAFCFPGSSAAQNSWCQHYIPSANYFFTGANSVWGIDDFITNYTNSSSAVRYALLNSPGTMTLNINLLPRIASLIENGQYGLDTDLSHWQWGSFYYGQHTWGSATLQSTWSSANFSPTIVYTSAP